MAHDFALRAKLKARGNRYEDFEIGRTFDHHWGRTITAGDNMLFTTLTLHYNPLYFNLDYARAHGHPDLVVNPMLVFSIVFGLSVEDLSEGGGAFLGVEELSFHQPVYPSETLTARSIVLSKRPSASDASVGIVTWHTQGFNGKSEQVVDFKRTNLINKRSASR